MPFIASARQQIAALPPDNATRITLEFLLNHAVGHLNPVPTQDVLDHLRQNGHPMSREQFQQTILNASRGGDVFIGVSRSGLYLIADRADAMATRDFYDARISAEQTHLANLRRLAVLQGWQPLP